MSLTYPPLRDTFSQPELRLAQLAPSKSLNLFPVNVAAVSVKSLIRRIACGCGGGGGGVGDNSGALRFLYLFSAGSIRAVTRLTLSFVCAVMEVRNLRTDSLKPLPQILCT